MMNEAVLGTLSLISVMVNSPLPAVETPSASLVIQKQILAEHGLDLTNRLPNEYGSQVFADNILLTLHYLKGDVESLKLDSKKSGSASIDWEKVRQPFEVSFTLSPGQVFAYHENILPKFADPAVTMNSRFYIEEGYKSLAGLGGNGVCHLASLISWVASEAGLGVTSQVNHNFAPVPGVPKEFGTSIRSQSPNQNLYIKNNQGFPVAFVFSADSGEVSLKLTR